MMNLGATGIADLYIGDTPVLAAYVGDELVYTRDSIPEVWKYIEIEIDSSDGTFIVPFAQYAAHGSESEVKIYVNGTFESDYHAQIDSLAGTGLFLDALPGPTAVVRIEPAHGIFPGWARGFGFGYYSNTDGCDALANRSKVLRVLNDPDYAHLDSATATGISFRQYQYYGCENLTADLTQEVAYPGIITIGRYYRHYQYRYCVSLVTVPEEAVYPDVTEIEGEYRQSQYFGCSSLSRAPAESRFDRVSTIGSNFRASMYAACSSLIDIPDEVPMDQLTSVTTYFRYGQYSACTSLTATAKEVYHPNLVSIGVSFRQAQYSFSDPLLIGGHIHAYGFHSLLNMSTSSYYHMFRCHTPFSAADTIPRYYTNRAETATAPVTNLTPNYRISYLENRTGIEGYHSLNYNWK